ncbi:MAG: prepilin-type N-terminal cleavage/methylation domain-containing protein [Puniceicoccales bacterium]|jgi:prepilin-type N-terminal cleavage/methylation domain-containing protein|nr:prepilin-type N-terminal cleavage/methylation domain-containing protein [Puniceicoccales bacterium]
MRSRGFSLLEFLLALSLLGTFLVLAQRLCHALAGTIGREVCTLENALTRARLLRALEEDLTAVDPRLLRCWKPDGYRWETESGIRIYFFERPAGRLHRRLGEGNFSEQSAMAEHVEEFALRCDGGEWQVCLRLAGEKIPRWSPLPRIAVAGRENL